MIVGKPAQCDGCKAYVATVQTRCHKCKKPVNVLPNCYRTR